MVARHYEGYRKKLTMGRKEKSDFSKQHAVSKDDVADTAGAGGRKADVCDLLSFGGPCYLNSIFGDFF